MVKSGLIGAAAGFLLAIVGAVVFPLACNPCAALLVGLAAGAMTGVFAKPLTGGSSAGEGAKAGAIATVGSLVGQMAGVLINGLFVGPEGAAELYRQFDIDLPIDSNIYWLSNVGGNCLCALVNIALGAGLGALGGLLWYQLSAKNQSTTGPMDEAL